MIALSRVNYKHFQLQACWDNYCLLDCPDTPITQQLRALAFVSMLDHLSFQTLAQSPLHCPQALI